MICSALSCSVEGDDHVHKIYILCDKEELVQTLINMYTMYVYTVY